MSNETVFNDRLVLAAQALRMVLESKGFVDDGDVVEVAERWSVSPIVDIYTDDLVDLDDSEYEDCHRLISLLADMMEPEDQR